MEKRKTFGEVKTGDILYVIEYADIPSIVEVHAGKIENPFEEAVTITIVEKVPNTPEPAGEFKVNYVGVNETKTFYDVFTTIEQAKERLSDFIAKKIKDAKMEMADSLLIIDKCKALIGRLENELKKYEHEIN